MDIVSYSALIPLGHLWLWLRHSVALTGSQTGAQESPSTSDVKLEYDVVPPDKGEGKAVPDNTAQGGSGQDPPRERERMYRLLR